MNVYIQLKSGNNIALTDFEYINYPDRSNKSIMNKVTDFTNFHLHNRLLTFVASNEILTLDSRDIEYIKFLDCSNK